MIDVATDNNGFGLFKPWKDGWLENTIKAGGVVFIFLFLSGLVWGEGLNPVATNPYVWGVHANRLITNVIGR